MTTKQGIKSLENLIDRYGWLDDPITIWEETGILLDGHARYELWKRKGGDGPPIRTLSFDNRGQALKWAIEYKLGGTRPNTNHRKTLESKLHGLRKTIKDKKGMKDTRQDVYFIGSHDGSIKIGIARNVKSRLKELQTGQPYPLKVLGVIKNGGRDLESKLHEKFTSYRLHGEWFKPCPELLDCIPA